MSDARANIPDFRISVDGQDVAGDLFTDITGKVRPRLISLRLSEKRGGEADQLDLVLDDADGKLAIPKRGATIRLQLGWKQGASVTPGLIDKGRFTVDETEWSGPPDQVTIRARSADLTEAFRTRRERTWKNTTLGAVAKDVAAANGLTAKVAASLTAIPVRLLTQHEQSDMALLRRIGREHDAVATVKDRTLILAPIGSGQSAGGKPLAAVTLRRSVGDGFRFRQLERSADAGVEARWHDQATGERKSVRVGGGNGKPKRLRRVYASEADARTAARAETGRAARAEAEFSLKLALGRPDLFPETPVALEGFKPDADALRWIVAEIWHDISGTALTSDLKLEPGA